MSSWWKQGDSLSTGLGKCNIRCLHRFKRITGKDLLMRRGESLKKPASHPSPLRRHALKKPTISAVRPSASGVNPRLNEAVVRQCHFFLPIGPGKGLYPPLASISFGCGARIQRSYGRYAAGNGNQLLANGEIARSGFSGTSGFPSK